MLYDLEGAEPKRNAAAAAARCQFKTTPGSNRGVRGEKEKNMNHGDTSCRSAEAALPERSRSLRKEGFPLVTPQRSFKKAFGELRMTKVTMAHFYRTY